jgi:hypothetical protein
MLACGLVLFPLLALHAQTAPPPDYNSSTPIQYGTGYMNGINLESASYGAYLDTVNVYQRSRESKITQDYEACYAAATNATQSKTCQTTSQTQSIALQLELSKIRSTSLVEHASRQNQIKQYWAAKTPNRQ